MRYANFDMFEEYSEDDINLSSFDVHATLNPKIWNEDDEMYPDVRRELLILARDFINEIGMKYIHPEDVVVTGSIANYNWSDEFSDIDLHILVNFKKIDAKPEILKKFFDLQKKEWNHRHEKMTIKGFTVELYVQNMNEDHKSSGIFSVLRNKWIKTPSEKKMDVKLNEQPIRKTSSEYMNEIDDMLSSYENDKSKENLENLYNDSIELFDEIREKRKSGMKTKNPEMSTGNIIFKVLRRTGYIGKLLSLRTDCYNLLHTIR